MSVDLTKNKKEKTNYQYLKDILAGNEEGLEFLEGFRSDYDKVIENLNDEISAKEAEIDEKDTEITNLQEEDLNSRIDTKMGSTGEIKWQADNIACQSMMEELNEAISRGVSIQKIENVLRAL